MFVMTDCEDEVAFCLDILSTHFVRLPSCLNQIRRTNKSRVNSHCYQYHELIQRVRRQKKTHFYGRKTLLVSPTVFSEQAPSRPALAFVAEPEVGLLRLLDDLDPGVHVVARHRLLSSGRGLIRRGTVWKMPRRARVSGYRCCLMMSERRRRVG